LSDIPSEDSDDAGLVSAALIGAMLCADCIVKRAGVPAPRVHAALAAIGKTVKVGDGAPLCAACKTTERVFQLV
jgi:hypothetical protein